MLHILNLFCSASFLMYGLSCLFMSHMVQEFARYRLVKFRVFTGIAQLLGALGLALGTRSALIGLSAAAGLSLLMLAGFITRLKIRDPLYLCLPSFAYMLLCTWLCLLYASLI